MIVLVVLGLVFFRDCRRFVGELIAMVTGDRRGDIDFFSFTGIGFGNVDVVIAGGLGRDLIGSRGLTLQNSRSPKLSLPGEPTA